MEYGSKGRSKLLRQAMEEYVERHFPGNPQTILFDVDDVNPFEYQQARLEAGVRRLKSKCKLSIRQICRVTSIGRGRVQRIVKGIKVKPIRLGKGKFDVNGWRHKWRLFKRGASYEEAGF